MALGPSPKLLGLCLLLLPLGLCVTGQDKTPAKKQPAKEKWWSLRPIVKPAVPLVTSEKFANWPRNPIDNFVLAKLIEKGMEPAPEADRRTLIRRLYFDL